jgi:hypothetical protein
MNPRVLSGSKQQIAAAVAGMNGEVREAIVFLDDPAAPGAPAEDLFAEMDAFTVRQAEVDDSRSALYRTLEGE